MTDSAIPPRPTYPPTASASVGDDQPAPAPAARTVRVPARAPRLPDWRTGQLLDLSGPDTRTPADPGQDSDPDTSGRTDGSARPGRRPRTGRRKTPPGQGDTPDTRTDSTPDAQPDGQDTEPAEDDEQRPARRRLRFSPRPTPAVSKDDETNEDEREQDTGNSGRGSDTAPPAPEAAPPLLSARTIPWGELRRRAQRFVLTNGTAAAVGAWGYGAFTDQWDVGLPQLFLSWMHDAAATSTSPYTPHVLGGLVIVGAVVAGGTALGFVLPLIHASRALCRVAFWACVRIPVASAVAALLLYGTA